MSQTPRPPTHGPREAASLATRVRNYIYLGVGAPLVSRLPAWLAYGLALAYADTLRRFDPKGVREVKLCLRRVFPSMPDSKVSKTARDYFRNRACLRVDVLRLSGAGRSLTKLVRVEGAESLDGALALGRGAVLCSGHFGSVRACAGVLGVLGYPVTLIANWSFEPSPLQKDAVKKSVIWKPIRRHLRRENLVVRSSKGTDLAVAFRASKILRQNEFVLTNVDAVTPQNDLSRAVSVDFLGGHAPVVPGPSEIAKLTGASMLTVFLKRRRDWRHLDLVIRPVKDTGTMAMQECMRELESEIRASPSQWEHWDMRKLVRLGLYPELEAADFYRRVYGEWKPWV